MPMHNKVVDNANENGKDVTPRDIIFRMDGLSSTVINNINVCPVSYI